MQVLLLIIAYLLGSIPSGLAIGKLFYKTDIRQHGSGNLGATNAFRVLGKKAGAFVTLFDIAKGTVATLLPFFFGIDSGIDPLYFGLAAVIGHIYPIFAGFRGGKAVATSCGVMLAADPKLVLFAAIIFFTVLKISKYVSLASLLGAIAGLFYGLIEFFLFDGGWQKLALLALFSVFIIYRHRTNIARIMNKTESKVKWL